MVREVRLLDQMLFNASATLPLGGALVLNLFALVVFPKSNLYIALLVAIVLGLFVWTTFALMTVIMPRVGGDFTYNARVLHPALALGANLCEFLAAGGSAGVVAYWMATQGLGPACSVIGGVTGNETLLRWATDFSTNKTTIFVTALVAVAAVSILSALGTRIVMRTMTVLVLIGTVGFAIGMACLIFTDIHGFRATIDDFAGAGSYDKTIAAGAKAGLLPEHGYSAHATIGAIYYGLTATVWVWWGTYTSAEFRGGGRRARQLKAIVGTGIVQGLLLFAGLAILLHATGYDFLVSALGGNFSGPGGAAAGTASYTYFAAVTAGSSVLVVVLGVAFLGWWLPGLYINLAMPYRALHTWAFDNLLPHRLAAVNNRTHTPLFAIALMFLAGSGAAAWTSFSASFFEVYSVVTLFAYFPVLLTGVSAFLIRWRRPDLYRDSAGYWKLGRIEVLPVAGLGCFSVAVLAIGITIGFHAELVPHHFVPAIIAPVVTFAIAAIWYFVARAYRRSRDGIEIDFQYRVIPPE